MVYLNLVCSVLILGYDFVIELTLEKVEAFIPHILSKMHIECFIPGNADKQVCFDM
jgi:secreted Zn-dependent insulinase-like peptidase